MEPMICVPLDRAQDHYTKCAKSTKLNFVMKISKLHGQIISVAGHKMTTIMQKVMLMMLFMMIMRMLLMLMTR